MKLYIFSISRNKVQKEEIEVIEKTKIFEQTKGLNTFRYKKEDLDVLDISYGAPKMISLNGSPENFVRKVIEYKKKKASNYETQMVREKNEIIEMQREYERYIVKNVTDLGYETRFILTFENADDGHIKGNVTKHRSKKVYDVHNLLNAQELISKFENGECMSVTNIFVDGAITNLYLEECMARMVSATDCIINMEKLREMSTKTKIEIDVK